MEGSAGWLVNGFSLIPSLIPKMASRQHTIQLLVLFPLEKCNCSSSPLNLTQLDLLVFLPFLS